MKRRGIFLGIIFLMLSLIGGITVYAYFAKEYSQNHSITTDIVNDNHIKEINTIEDFYKEIDLYQDADSNQAPVNPEFNSPAYANNVRKTLKLMSDFTLINDAIITSDCHINLNGHKINLNGYRFNIRNTFKGTISIYDGSPTKGGKIIDSVANNKLIVDTPNACVDINASYLDTNITLSLVNVSKTEVLNSAIKLAYSNIANNGVNDFYSTAEAFQGFGNPTKCTMQGHSAAANVLGCIYIKDNLSLIDHYYNYNVKLSYVSSNKTALSDSGIVDASKSDNSVLTITADYEGTTMSADVNVHVVTAADYEKASVLTLVQYMERYYSEKDGKLLITNQILLPKINTYFNKPYTYALYESSQTHSSDQVDDSFDKVAYNDYIIVTITNQTKFIEIKSGAATSNKIAVIGKATSIIDDDYAYCVGIMAKHYHNQITISETISGGTNGYNDVELLIDPTAEGYNRLDKITYELVGNDEKTYLISPLNTANQLLHVADQKIDSSVTLPYLGQTVFLNAYFSFPKGESSEAKVISLLVPIVYKPKSGGGSSFSTFAPYYTYFNKEFNKATNGLSYLSFEMPLFFQSQYPTYTLIPYEKITNPDLSITYNRIDEATNKLFDVSIKIPGGVNGNEREKIDTYVTNKALDFNAYLNNSNARTEVTIDPYLIDMSTKDYVFLYVPIEYSKSDGLQYVIDLNGTKTAFKSIDALYKDANFASLDVGAYKFKSALRIPGIVRYQNALSKLSDSEMFEDEVFYKYVYNILHSDKPYVDNKTTFIETSRLGTEIKSFDFSTKATIDPFFGSFKGINLLTGLVKLDLTGRNIPVVLNGFKVAEPSGAASKITRTWIDQMGYIGSISTLKVLILRNTGIYDLTVPTTGVIRFPDTASDNKLITKLQGLTSLVEIDLSNQAATPQNGEPMNRIARFNGLEKLPSLKKVNVSYNIFKGGHFTGFLSILNGIFDSVVNSLYGSSGGPNLAIFAIIKSKSPDVVLTNDGVNITLAPETKQIIYAISSLEYQDRLPNGVAIENVYADYNQGDLTQKANMFKVKEHYYDYLPNHDEANDEQRLSYTLAKISFTPSETGFTFTISYNAEFQEYSWLWGWQKNNDAVIPQIDYSYFYEVTRY